jgi:putative tryptophan/tyrosine transport system substrate-binding protein
MLRRDLMMLLGGAAVAWPLGASAQQPAKMARVGVLLVSATNNPVTEGFLENFKSALQKLGWTDGKNIRIDYRTVAPSDVEQMQVLAKELLSLTPDVILAHNSLVVAAFQRETTTIPVVFVSVTDPVASGFVASLSHPGGNITGFSNFDPTLVGKYIEILKEIKPGMTAVIELFNPSNADRFTTTHPILEAAARYHAVDLTPAPVRNSSDIEHVISGLADKPTIGLIVAGEPLFAGRQNLDLVVSLTTRYRVPAIYSFRFFAEAGGLISYGSDLFDSFRKAPTYIDRILKGASPSDLPVQLPTKFEMVINLKTAQAMGLALPATLIARADEVIE